VLEVEESSREAAKKVTKSGIPEIEQGVLPSSQAPALIKSFSGKSAKVSDTITRLKEVENPTDLVLQIRS
jgi:hypothetical protein